MTESAAAGTSATADRPIAIIGLACRYPDAEDPASLLNTVLAGRRAFRRIPPARLDLTDYHDPDPQQRDATYGTRAALLEGWRFDRAAFGISRPEFASAHLAHWLALETTARALAATGFPGGTGLPTDRAGVYLGHTPARDGTSATALRLRWPYARRVFADALAASQVPADIGDQVLSEAAARYLAPFPPVTAQSLAGNTAATIATAICSQFGLRGGGQTVDAAGASSLAAIASACLALAADELDLAVAGGVDLNIEPLDLVALAKAGVLARDAMLIYDEHPTGFLPGEGCGIVLLMRTADARAANLPVYAEIVGWGQAAGRPAQRDPARQSSPARPADRLAAQTDTRLLAMRRAHEMANLDPADIQLIEGCGSGVGAADAAELAALAALRSGARNAAVLGAISANIGHTGAAAGAAGLIKAALAIANGVLPPSAGVQTPHPVLRDGRAALRVPAAPEPWPSGTRHASVAAAGQDGLVVHLILRGESGGHAGPPRAVKIAARTGLLSGARQAGPGHIFAYLLGAADQQAMIELLSMIVTRAPWLSDAELQDLAVHLSRETADGRAPGQHEIRIALTASDQQGLAALAAEARTLVPALERGTLTMRPGIYAAAGRTGCAHPRVAAVMSSRPDDLDGLPQHELTRMLEILRVLDNLGAEIGAAVGHGIGELAGLVWAGCMAEADARTLLALRSAALAATPSAAPGAVANLFSKLGSFMFLPPRRRLISGCTGGELAEPSAIVEALCAELFEARLAASSGDHAGLLASAVTTAAEGAALLVQTGQDPDLAAVMAQLGPESSGSRGDACLPTAVSIDGDPADDANLAQVAAALFAAGALNKPQVLYAQRPVRPIDIWREPVFVTHPCQRQAGNEDPTCESASVGQAAALPLMRAESGRAEAGRTTPAANGASKIGASHVGRTVGAATVGARTVGARTVGARVVGSHMAASDIGAVAGVTPWLRCFAEQTQKPSFPLPVGDDQPWRVYTGGCGPLGHKVREIFRHDPAAERTLAVLGPLDEAATREALVLAVNDAIGTGRLVAIGHGPALSGVWGTLHAEHPSVGITAMRAQLTIAGLSAARRVAAATPGDFRELVIGPDGTVAEPVMSELSRLGGGDFPLGPDDVVLVSSGSGAAGLALAQVLACSGAAVAIIGRARRAHDEAVVAGLEKLRRAGSRVCYELVDLADHGAVSVAVRRIEARFGYVTAISHGVGPVPRGALAALDVATVHSLVREHTAPLDQVAAAVRAVTRGEAHPGRLRLIATFGSVTGRYGLVEEGMGALVTAAIAEDGERIAAARPGCQALHVDWPAWSGEALGERADLADVMARAGFTAMPVSEGSRLLLKTLATENLPRRIGLHGRVGVLAPRPIAAASQLGRGRAPERFIERVLVHYPGVELIAEARLSLLTDPYLADYRADGVPVLPPTMAIEAMAQAASALAGTRARHATQVSMSAPVVLPAGARDSQTVLRIFARREGDSIDVRIRSDNSGFAVNHGRAVFNLGDDTFGADPGCGSGETVAANGSQVDSHVADGFAVGDSELGESALYGAILFQAGRFKRLRSVRLTGNESAEGLASVADELAWFGAVPPARASAVRQELVLGSAALSDAVLQVVQACVPHRRLMFAGCESVTFSESLCTGAMPDDVATIRLTSDGTPDSGLAERDRFWHAHVIDAFGQAAMSWTGLRMRDAGPAINSDDHGLGVVLCSVNP